MRFDVGRHAAVPPAATAAAALPPSECRLPSHPQAAMSQVQVSNVPTSASPEELRQLFAQLGPVKSLLTSFEATKPEGTVSEAGCSSPTAPAGCSTADRHC